MALFPLDDLLGGIKSIGVRLLGKKSDGNLGNVSVTDEGAVLTQQVSGNIDEIINDIYSTINIIAKKQSEDPTVLGATWDKNSSPILTRINDAEGMVANVGQDFNFVKNDFDSAPIYGEIEEVVDTYNNIFMRIPKFYIRKLDGASFKSWQVSKKKYPGFYLPWCFWDFTNNRELPYVDIGKYKASLSDGNKLQSIPNVYPLCNKHIVDFRDYAKNNNAGGLDGYQLLDIHVVDLLRTLFFIEFATLNSQAIMTSFTEGRYDANDKAVAVTDQGNTIVVSNTTGGYYRIGQTISIHLAGATISNLPNTYGRTITNIEVNEPEVGQTTITFDGDPINVAVDDYIINTGWKNGFSSGIAASSGYIVANDGKYPCMYRGIESPFGDIWQFIDGLNINARQGYVCKNASKYVSNSFILPDYEELGYVNHSANGYVKEMGWDPNHPYMELATTITGSTTPTQYYCDYYYQSTAQYIARFGGSWISAGDAGFSCWRLAASSSSAHVYFGGRLLKKAL